MEYIKNTSIDFNRNLYNLTELQYEIINKRIESEDEVECLLQHSINISKFKTDLFNNLADIDKAVELVLNNLSNGSKILIVSDYDSDGINSAIVLDYYFNKLIQYDNAEIMINKRKHGNGFNKNLVERVINKKPDLIITSDHGSSDESSYAFIKEQLPNVKILVTDHHIIPKDNYPVSADVLINNQREDSTYSKDVSGCFIAFLLTVACHTIANNRLDNLNEFYEIIPNVAISTISDVMALNVPINRQIVNLGINIINSGKYPKWKAFNKAFNIYDFITSKIIGWNIAPVINTGNRLDKEQTIFDVMSEVDEDIFKKDVNILVELNKLRKNETKRVMKHLDTLEGVYGKTVIINSKYNINGIISNNIVKQYNRPTICFSEVEKDGKILLAGSGRSINGINLHEVISEINKSGILLKYGGHYGAVGLSLYKENYDEFKKLFNKLLSKREMKKDTVMYYDIDIHNTKVGYELWEEVRSLMPYGKKFSEPIFRSKFKVNKVLAYNSFAKFYLKDNDNDLVMASYFYNGETKEEVEAKLEGVLIIDILFNISTNDFISNTSVNLNIVTIRS